MSNVFEAQAVAVEGELHTEVMADQAEALRDNGGGGLAVKGKRGFQARDDRDDNLISMTEKLIELPVNGILTVALSTTQVAIAIRILTVVTGKTFVRRKMGKDQVIKRLS